jgi:hypothetical protein
MRLVLLCACLLPAFSLATDKPRFTLAQPEVLDKLGIVHHYPKGTGWDVDGCGNLFIFIGDQPIAFYNAPQWISVAQAGKEKFSKNKVG